MGQIFLQKLHQAMYML